MVPRGADTPEVLRDVTTGLHGIEPGPLPQPVGVDLLALDGLSRGERGPVGQRVEPLPLAPDALGAQAPSFRVEADHTVVYGEFREDR